MNTDKFYQWTTTELENILKDESMKAICLNIYDQDNNEISLEWIGIADYVDAESFTSDECYASRNMSQVFHAHFSESEAIDFTDIEEIIRDLIMDIKNELEYFEVIAFGYVDNTIYFIKEKEDELYENELIYS